MDKQQSAVEEFFKDLPSEDKKGQDIFGDGTGTNTDKTPVTEKVEDKEEDVPDSIKNRQHRRLEAKLQAERESNIALTERIKMLSEQEKFAKEVEIDPRIAKMFDTTEVGKENALRLSEVISDMSAKAKEEALQEIESRKELERTEQKQYESFIDNKLEALEEHYNVDLTSDTPQARKTRTEFLEMVQKLSPKDEEGTITGYADFESTFEVYQSSHTEKKDNTRQKEIASRSMQRSGSGIEQAPEGPMTFARAKSMIDKQYGN